MKIPFSQPFHLKVPLTSMLLCFTLVACSTVTTSSTTNVNKAANYYGKAVEYSLASNYDLAIEQYSKAILEDPGFAAAYEGRAHAYQAKGDQDAALSDYLQTAKLTYKDASGVYLRMGTTQLDKGEYSLAINSFGKSISERSYNPLAYEKRGDTYALVGDKTKAASDYREAIRLLQNPEDAVSGVGVVVSSTSVRDSVQGIEQKLKNVEP